MELIKAVLLGILQGLTEFLPISSSGHLVIGAELLDYQDAGISFEVFLHLGTLIAVIIAFHTELLQMLKSLTSTSEQRAEDPELQRYYMWNWYVIAATIPAVFVGLFLKDSIERIFDNILITFAMLAVTGLIMVLTTKVPKQKGEITMLRSLLIGTAQAMAILPGLSRSGSTIFAGMVLGVQRERAARFAFIMSIPAILGAAVLKLGDLLATPPGAEKIVALVTGTTASVISGYFAIVLLMRVVRKGKLHWFGYYCFFLSATGFGWYFFLS